MPQGLTNIAAAERALAVAIAAFALIATASAIAMTIDLRLLPNGENIWLKPLRFALAFAIHTATLRWFSRLTARGAAADHWFALSVWLQLAAIVIEMICIGVQAGRGVPSHFNYATPFDRAIFTIMGLGTLALLAGFLLILLGLVRRPGPPVAGAAVVIAMTFATLGGFAGVAMVMPTAEQAGQLEAGVRPATIGSHLVGVASGAKLPFFGWDLKAGDWRVPHFLGLHAMQALPFVAWLARRRRRAEQQIALSVAASGYGLLFAWACHQTLSARAAFVLADTPWLLASLILYVAGVVLAMWPRAMGQVNASSFGR